ncbi:outer membrane protein assembly factor BamB family protein [Streptacidiphilus griseoplanus]|uniref:outer membrane protein assembly factor BamB family protein n=1 Tax=Peterkaempfera griseoplana TaxID=66896 RepID=UPI0006E15D7E|nr:PQQ-binding-like beta-propeller repeat protein [Peterkaempfera griseoplana]
MTGLVLAGVTAALSTTAVAAPAAPAVSAAAPVTPVASASDWPYAGGDLGDTHNAAAERTIGSGNVAGLQTKWTFTTGASVSATPTVADGYVYAPDWAGNLYKVQATTGQQIWKHQVSDYTGIAGDISRLSPAYWNGTIVTGSGEQRNSSTAGAFLFGIDALTGNRLWKTQIDADPAAIVTSSPVIADGVVYVGVSSKAEKFAPPYTFRGSVVALDAVTGQKLWKTYVVPEGYTGGAVWGSNPVVNPKTGLVYVGTGNNYTVPPGVCTSPDETGCDPGAEDNYQDAIVAFDMHTGAIVWATKTLTADTWTVGQRFGDDFDFGAGPNLFTTTVNGKATDLLGIGQKSGVYWTLDPATGKIVWATAVGPGGNLGGLQWGSAVDGKRIYVANTNTNHLPVQLTSATGETSTTTGGFWAALEPATGKILWETATPGSASPMSFVSSANGVVYGGSTNPAGNNMYALDAATGAVKWGFPSGGAVLGGASIVDGSVYWGSGYHTQNLGPFFPANGDNNKLYAFSLPQSLPQTVYVSPTAATSAAGTSCSTPTFRSINAAIRGVAAGGRVVVCDGTFREDVSVTKPLSLEARSNVTVDATGLVNGIEISASDVTVTGFTVKNAVGEGILVNSVKNVTIANTIVSDNNTGTGPNAVANAYPPCKGAEGEPGDCGGGIHLLGSSNVTVTAGTVSGNSTGILISDETGPASGSTFTGNSVHGNASGSGFTLVSRNGAAAPGGVRAPGAGGVFGNTITGNNVFDNGLGAGGGGVTLASASAGGAVYGNTVQNNVMTGNGWAAVTVHGSASGSDLGGNIVRNNQIGTNNTVGDTRTGTTADLQTTGVLVSTVDPVSVQITGNTIAGNVFGIWTHGPVTATNAAGANTFSNVTTPVSAH